MHNLSTIPGHDNCSDRHLHFRGDEPADRQRYNADTAAWQSGMSAADLPLMVAWFPTAMPKGPAIGDPESTTWSAFADVFGHRREGEKDGPNFVPARFKLEADGRHVRRLRDNVIARTAVALDIEASKKTGELPPALDEVARRLAALGLAGIVYTSHSHEPPHKVRCRVVMPLSSEIAPDLPAPEVMAEHLGLLGVLDLSKVGASSLFYLPSSPEGALERHQEIIVHGAPTDATWLVERSSALLAARNAEEERLAAEAHKEAAARREANLAAGFDPDDGIIEKLRNCFDLASLLASHGYARRGAKFRHPNSSSGAFGADIRAFGGIERVYSHNGTDPLHRDNLPSWCGGVTALDAVDVVIILEFGGDRTRALAELAERFGLNKRLEQRTIAKLLFRLIGQQAPQDVIEISAFNEGHRLGLSRAEICRVAQWVAAQAAV